MTAVVVWDHEPDQAELLNYRLSLGWKPTPTAFVDGDQILGYACSLGD